MSTCYTIALSQIQSEPATILFLDTCILLDIIRAPVRENIVPDSIKFAKELLEKSSESPKSLWLVTSETVKTEWEEHADEIVEDTEREILKLESRRNHFLTAAKAATDVDYPYGQTESGVDLAKKLKAISKSVLDACIVIPPEDSHMISAMHRVKKYLPPAKRGKAEPKDCEIYELFLCLCRDIQEKEVDLIFASSNTQDYGPKNSGGIEKELTEVKARFVTHWNWLNAALDGRT